MEAYTPTTDELEAQADAAAASVDPDEVPTVLGIPLNRILTIGRGPINIVAASLASWLLVHVHALGLFHVQHDGLSTAIAQGVVWIVTAILTDHSLAQWVKGHHVAMQAQAAIHAAAVSSIQAGEAAQLNASAGHEPYDPEAASVESPLTPQEVAAVDAEGEATLDPDVEELPDSAPLPSDEDELGSPPPEGV
jgi:hypothetical protein